MTSLPNTFQPEPAKVEQIITEFFSKSLHIILESRSPYASSRNFSGEQTVSSPSSTSSSSSARHRDKWFNLALREWPNMENLDFWRHGNVEPMIIDVILVHRTLNSDVVRPSPGSKVDIVRNPSDQLLGGWNAGQEELLYETKSEKIIERWVVQYESRKGSGILREFSSGKKFGSSPSIHSSETTALFHKKMYKRSVILLRSLYVTVRLLPAYKLIRDLNSSGRIHPYRLTYKVSSFVEPFTRTEEAEMQQFNFVPVDTYSGRLCLSVTYCPALLEVGSDPSTPISTQFISDYVGSPNIDPLRRLPSLPFTQSPVSPSHVAFVRRHSWSSDLHRDMTSVYPSPSPTYSDSRTFAPKPNSHLLPPRGCMKIDSSSPASSPHHLSDTPRLSNDSLDHKKSFDEYWPSPPFSPSPSPSPPTHLSSSHLSKALSRSESAPVSIPSAKLGRGPGLPNPVLPPSPSPKGTRPGYSSRSDSLKAQLSRSRISATQSPPRDNKYQGNQDLQAGTSQANNAANEMVSFAKDELGTFFGVKTPFSRSSSRRSFQDDFDDSDLPFAVDEDDITDPCNRYEYLEGKKPTSESPESRLLLVGKKSHDAAIGSLVRMLQTAAPLRQDSSISSKFPQVSRAEAWYKDNQNNQNLDSGNRIQQNAPPSTGIATSGLVMSKTTADALEDLKSYREMKNRLLRQDGYQSVEDIQAAKTQDSGTSEF